MLMKLYKVTMLDGFQSEFSAHDPEDALRKAACNAMDVIREWPMTPQQLCEALEVKTLELIEV